MVCRSRFGVEIRANNNTDALIERNHRVLNFDAAQRRDVLNLHRWVDGNGCIARAETAYLAHCEDLFRVASSGDSLVAWLEALVEDGCVCLSQFFGKVQPRSSILITNIS